MASGRSSSLTLPRSTGFRASGSSHRRPTRRHSSSGSGGPTRRWPPRASPTWSSTWRSRPSGSSHTSSTRSWTITGRRSMRSASRMRSAISSPMSRTLSASCPWIDSPTRARCFAWRRSSATATPPATSCTPATGRSRTGSSRIGSSAWGRSGPIRSSVGPPSASRARTRPCGSGGSPRTTSPSTYRRAAASRRRSRSRSTGWSSRPRSPRATGQARA